MVDPGVGGMLVGGGKLDGNLMNSVYGFRVVGQDDKELKSPVAEKVKSNHNLC